MEAGSEVERGLWPRGGFPSAAGGLALAPFHGWSCRSAGWDFSGWVWSLCLVVNAILGLVIKGCYTSACNRGVWIGGMREQLPAAALPGTVPQITTRLQPDIKNMKQLGFLLSSSVSPWGLLVSVFQPGKPGGSRVLPPRGCKAQGPQPSCPQPGPQMGPLGSKWSEETEVTGADCVLTAGGHNAHLGVHQAGMEGGTRLTRSAAAFLLLFLGKLLSRRWCQNRTAAPDSLPEPPRRFWVSVPPLSPHPSLRPWVLCPPPRVLCHPGASTSAGQTIIIPFRAEPPGLVAFLTSDPRGLGAGNFLGLRLLPWAGQVTATGVTAMGVTTMGVSTGRPLWPQPAPRCRVMPLLAQHSPFPRVLLPLPLVLHPSRRGRESPRCWGCSWHAGE